MSCQRMKGTWRVDVGGSAGEGGDTCAEAGPQVLIATVGDRAPMLMAKTQAAVGEGDREAWCQAVELMGMVRGVVAGGQDKGQ